MVGSGSLVIDPAHLEGGDGSIELAMRLWSSHNPPITYNDFQSLYFQLKRNGYEDGGAPEAETAAERQVRMKAMYQEIQSEVHGPDHLVLAAAVAAGKAKSLAAEKNERLAMQLKASAERTAPRPPAPGGFEQRTSRVAAGDLLGLEDADPADLENPFGAERYPIDTPRRQSPESEPGDSPDRLYRFRDAQRILDDEAATHTEASQEEIDRHNKLAYLLSTLEGSDERQIRFVLAVERLAKDYKDEYRKELSDVAYDEQPSLKTWAMERLCEMTADVYPTEDQLRAHVQALGRLCDRDPEMSRRHAKNLWDSSSASASPEAQPSDPKRQLPFETPSKYPTTPSRRDPSQAEVVNVMDTMATGLGGR